MRTFELHREVDETGVSGTGVVARGVEWPDGRVALRWGTRFRSTTVYDNVGDVIEIHGHGGKTKLVYADDPKRMVEIHKPHLQLGFEGKYEYDAISHNCGPVQPGVRERYDRIRSLLVPAGWSVCATFWVDGTGLLQAESPERHLHGQDFEQLVASFTVYSDRIEPYYDFPHGERSEYHAIVDGVTAYAQPRRFRRL